MSQTSFGDAAHKRYDFLDRLDALERKGEIHQVKNPGDPSERVIEILEPGNFRLDKEDEPSPAPLPIPTPLQDPTPPATTIHNEFHGTVHAFAQTTGDGSPIHQTLNLSASDHAAVLELVDHLIREIRQNNEISSDALHEANLLNIELQKSKPLAERIKSYIETIKLLVGTAHVLTPILTDIYHKCFPALS